VIYNDSIVFVYAKKKAVVGETDKGLEVTIAEQRKTVWLPKSIGVIYSDHYGGGWNMPLWLAREKGLEYDAYPAGDYPDDEHDDWTGRATH
jgi:hypothetical protein